MRASETCAPRAFLTPRPIESTNARGTPAVFQKALKIQPQHAAHPRAARGNHVCARSARHCRACSRRFPSRSRAPRRFRVRPNASESAAGTPGAAGRHACGIENSRRAEQSSRSQMPGACGTLHRLREKISGRRLKLAAVRSARASPRDSSATCVCRPRACPSPRRYSTFTRPDFQYSRNGTSVRPTPAIRQRAGRSRACATTGGACAWLVLLMARALVGLDVGVEQERLAVLDARVGTAEIYVTGANRLHPRCRAARYRPRPSPRSCNRGRPCDWSQNFRRHRKQAESASPRDGRRIALIDPRPATTRARRWLDQEFADDDSVSATSA